MLDKTNPDKIISAAASASIGGIMDKQRIREKSSVDNSHIYLLEKSKRGVLNVLFGRTMVIIVLLAAQVFLLYRMFSSLRYVKYVYAGLQVLNVGAHSKLFCFKNFSRVIGIHCTKAAVVVEFRLNKTSKAKEACFKAHLGKSHIRINAFKRGFINIILGKLKDMLRIFF